MSDRFASDDIVETHRGMEICRARDGQHYFRVVSKNGQILATSETYTRPSKARRGADALLRRMSRIMGVRSPV